MSHELTSYDRFSIGMSVASTLITGMGALIGAFQLRANAQMYSEELFWGIVVALCVGIIVTARGARRTASALKKQQEVLELQGWIIDDSRPYLLSKAGKACVQAQADFDASEKAAQDTFIKSGNVTEVVRELEKTSKVQKDKLGKNRACLEWLNGTVKK